MQKGMNINFIVLGTRLRYAAVIKKKLNKMYRARIQGDYEAEDRGSGVVPAAALAAGLPASPRRCQAGVSGVSGKCSWCRANIHYFLFFFFYFFYCPRNLIQ